MIKNGVSLAVATLLGFSIMLQTGCKKGEEPGTATDPKSEIFNIKYAIKTAGSGADNTRRIAVLRSAYKAAGELNERWPDEPSIDPFLSKTAKTLNQIPKTVFFLSMDVRDFDSFDWALSRPENINISAPEFMTVWKLGPKWRSRILKDYAEQALPLYMETAVEQKNVEFFDAHIEAFKAGGYTLHPPVEHSIFYYKYCRFMGEQFAVAIQENDLPRIRLLLTYMPQRSAVESLDDKTIRLLKNLGDYLFYQQSDEALALSFIHLGYPLNPITLSRTPFSSSLVKILTADPAYAVTVFQLDKWHGPLGPQETLFLLSLSDDLLKTVDLRYIDETVKLCLSKDKTKLALKLIHVRYTAPYSDEAYDKLLGWAVRSANTDFFRYILSLKEGMTIQQIKLAQLAENDKMFVKYAPSVLTYISKNENKAGYAGPTLEESIRDVVTGSNYNAALYLIKKYKLADKWERLPSEPTLLMEVCMAGNLPAAKYLIETKKEDPLPKTRYSRKETSLFGAAKAMEGNLNLIHLAAQNGNASLIKYLASKKLSVNAQTYFGVTPLMYAVSQGHLEAVKMLLSLGANVNTTMDSSLKGEPMPEKGSFTQLSSAYRRAEYGKHEEILALLKKAGARP